MLTSLKLEADCFFNLTTMDYSLCPAPPFELQGSTTIKSQSGNAGVLSGGIKKEKYFIF